MEIFQQFISYIDTNFRPLIVLISTLLALFFYWKKIGNNIVCSFKVSSDRLSSTRIDDLVLTNKKDKPVPIYAIHAVFDKELLLTLCECNPPLILKPYESIAVNTEAYSNLFIGADAYYPEYIDAEILIESVNGLIKCKSHFYNRNLLNSDFRRIMKSISKFNGIVHSGNFSYVLIYRFEDKVHTTFIHESGFLENDWSFDYNKIGIPVDFKLDEKIINKFLIDCKYVELFTSYNIYKYDCRSYDLVFSSTANKVSELSIR